MHTYGLLGNSDLVADTQEGKKLREGPLSKSNSHTDKPLYISVVGSEVRFKRRLYFTQRTPLY